MKIKNISTVILAALSIMYATSCESDDVDTSISVIKDSLTPENDLDKWLMKNYVEPYNIELRYRWEDNEIDMNYILVPAQYEYSVMMAKMIKYICFDAFDKVTGNTDFIRANFPKTIQLVGNPGWNSNSSMTLGSSEGGYKINLWYVNHLGDELWDYTTWTKIGYVYENREELNSIFFHTIIHEFGHTFHQKVPYTNEFTQVTGTNYLGGMYTSEFVDESDASIQAHGFVTAYASYNADEDFAETFSTYLCSTDDEFQALLDRAGNDGLSKINTKMRLIREYFQENWNLDIDAVRKEIQEREANISEVDFTDISL